MPCMSGREAVTDEELAEVERLSATDLLAEMAPRLVPEVRAARLWRSVVVYNDEQGRRYGANRA